MTRDEEMDKFINEIDDDCPAQLMDLLDSDAKTWRIGVIKEFVSDHIWKKDVENKLKRLSKENAMMIGLLVTLIGIALKIAIFGA